MPRDDTDLVDNRHLTDSARISPKGNHDRGPPNRINDLNYSDWMKYQKSFYRYPGDQTAVTESVYFFTKERYDDRISRTLLIGFDTVDGAEIETDRDIVERDAETIADVVAILENADADGYDFVQIDLREHIASPAALQEFLDEHADPLWTALRNALRDDRFAGVFVGLPSKDGSGYPVPWSVAGSCRDHVRLKDEKIGLVEDDQELVYNLYVQAQDDPRNPTTLHPDTIHYTDSPGIEIPPWLIPKPPARDEDEILHPAKYPETLIEQFIELFSAEGDSVFDPMVGTGSTVKAAIRKERHGYGTDLNEQYVDIAQDRVESEYRMTLSGEIEPRADSLIIQEDATMLTAPELADKEFDYVVTSPPYWSMLNNPGSENQKERRDSGLPLKYSDSDADVGNIEAYGDFLDTLETVYTKVNEKLAPDGHLTVVVKNVKRDHVIFPLAWDLVERLCGPDGTYEYVGNTFWCQDDIGVKPFAVGTHWVSNTLHNYCLHFKNQSNQSD